MADQPDRNQPARKARPASASAEGKQASRPARPARSASAAKPASSSGAAAARQAAAAPVAAPVKPGVPTAAKAARPAKQAVPAGAAAAEALPEEEEEQEPSMVSQLLRDSPSWLVSAIAHLVIVLALAVWILPPKEEPEVPNLSINPNIVEEPIEELEIEPLEELDVEVAPEVTSFEAQPDTEMISDQMMASEAMDLDAAQMTVEVPEISVGPPVSAGLMTNIGAVSGSGMSGRGRAARQALVASGGGSPDSEKAVALALKWLAAHQLPDGGWHFDHRMAPSCQGKCDDTIGRHLEARNAATAMGLLPFLGAGQTHMEGEYKEVVYAGLNYLMNHEKKTKEGGSWHEPGGTMYSHGLASIVICEAYGMTRDERLRMPAQAAVYYIMNNQDKIKGGWGYGGPGDDTSVAGWQIMALKSADMAYLEVWPNSIRGIDHFLNSVSADSGSSYGYRGPGRGGATTAVGVLSRLYIGKHFGWDKNHEALQRAMETMAKDGPAKNNLYRDYYAAQFMFQMTGAKGEMWEKWNTAMRDGLVNTQDQTGHQAGSWKSGYREGRLMNTCLSTLILEVYYRHMLIAKDEAVQEHDFPLD